MSKSSFDFAVANLSEGRGAATILFCFVLEKIKQKNVFFCDSSVTLSFNGVLYLCQFVLA